MAAAKRKNYINSEYIPEKRLLYIYNKYMEAKHIT